MVDLDPLDADDLEWLRDTHQHARRRDRLGGRHAASSRGWKQDSERFVKVMPQDYKRVLEAARQAREQGIDEIEAIMAAAHG